MRIITSCFAAGRLSGAPLLFCLVFCGELGGEATSVPCEAAAQAGFENRGKEINSLVLGDERNGFSNH